MNESILPPDVGFVFAKNGKCKVVNLEDGKNQQDELISQGYILTATVQLSIIFERVLNNVEGVERQIKEMRCTK